jgi:hypothetical protein
MNLTREKFTPDSLRIMDQVSHLIFIVENLIQFGKTAAQGDDFDVAEKEAEKVAKYVEGVSTDLLATIFHTKKNRQKLQKKAYRKALDGFGAAHAAAMKLVAIDRAATGGEGKGIGGSVVTRLEYLKQFWDDQHEGTPTGAVTPSHAVSSTPNGDVQATY